MNNFKKILNYAYNITLYFQRPFHSNFRNEMKQKMIRKGIPLPDEGEHECKSQV